MVGRKGREMNEDNQERRDLRRFEVSMVSKADIGGAPFFNSPIDKS